MRLGSFKLPMDTLSASSISKFVSCPEAWRRRYLLKERDGFGVDRFVGTVDHGTLAGAFDVKLKTGEVWDTEYVAGAYDWCWGVELEKEIRMNGDPTWGDNDPEKLRERGKLMATTYWNALGGVVEPVAIEQRFEETISGVPVPIIGYVDIEDKPSIIERKTAKTKLSKPKPAWSFQARVYQLFIRKPVEWQITTKQVTPQLCLGRDVPGLTLPVQSADHTVRMIQQTVHQLNDFYQRYGADTPWPTLGTFHDWLCGYCQHGPAMKSDCVAWAK